ncbi:MAG TPA: AmmeMemoRadiSam system protein A [Chloroflexi bacterium]|nr:AmmeMemoRadiSam system protein A [Chloroflexota bacterium]
MPLSSEERQVLLSLAREAITRAVRGQEPPPVDLDGLPESLRRDGASFVTLTMHGDLRGCIGSLEPRQSLALDVRENAVSAAFRDPRFSPVREDELGDLRVEVSVLSEPKPLSYDGPDDLIAQLRLGVDGVVIESGWNRATFLPQVWEKLPTPRQFLEHLCLKAYLPADAYRKPGLDVYTYQVEKFEERKDVRRG